MQADGETDDPGEAEAFCSTCREPIHPRARKCKTCDSYQDWRRHLSMSASVLALLVALVSVLSFAIPTMAEFLKEDGSNVSIAYQGMLRGNIYFMVSNSGNRPGAIGDGGINISYGTDRRVIPLSRAEAPPVIMPGTSQQVSFVLADVYRRQIPQVFAEQFDARTGTSPRGGTAVFVIQAIEFDGRRHSYVHEVGFDELHSAVTSVDPRCLNARERLQAGGLSQAESAFLQANCAPSSN